MIIEKPWGKEEHLKLTETYWVKILFINPEQRISLQNHKNRNEIWTIIQGKAVVNLDDDEFAVGKHNTLVIPAGTKHRIHNYDKKEILILCEVATGVPKDEDIFRYEDDYKRVK